MHPLGGTLLRIGLQMSPPGPVGGTDVNVTTGLGGGGFGAFATTLVVGAILVVVAPDWTRARMRDVVDDAIGSFVYGLIGLVLVIFVVVFTFFTIIGIPFAILFGILATLLWAAGAAIGFLAIADNILGERESWVVPLLLAAAMNGLLALTGIGGLISFAVGAAGFGTVLRTWL